jgi:hypothetical protein
LPGSARDVKPGLLGITGDGEAKLTFGSRSFVGAVTGSIAEGTLQFTYGDAPKPGQGRCATACEATAVMRIEGESWRRSVKSR